MDCVNISCKNIFFVWILLFGADFLCAQKVVQDAHSDKYSEQIRNAEKGIDSFLFQAQELEQKYASDEFIDKYLNAEKIRVEKQEQFNSKKLFGFNLPINETGLQVNVYNRDLMLFGTVASRWFFDFVFFKLFSDFARKSLLDLSLRQPEALLSLLKNLDYAVEQKNDQQINQARLALENFVDMATSSKELVKNLCLVAFFAVSTNMVHQAKNYFRLNSLFKQNLMDFVMLNAVNNANSVPVDNSLSAFLNDKTIAGIPIDFIQTTGLDVLNSFLCEYGLTPSWVMENKFDLVRGGVFAAFFVWWARKNIYKPITLNYFIGQRKDLIAALNNFMVDEMEKKSWQNSSWKSSLQICHNVHLRCGK